MTFPRMVEKHKHPAAVSAWNESRTLLCQDCGGALDWTPTEDDYSTTIENPYCQIVCGKCVEGGLEKGTYMLPADFFGSFQLTDADGNEVEITDLPPCSVH